LLTDKEFYALPAAGVCRSAPEISYSSLWRALRPWGGVANCAGVMRFPAPLHARRGNVYQQHNDEAEDRQC